MCVMMLCRVRWLDMVGGEGQERNMETIVIANVSDINVNWIVHVCKHGKRSNTE